MDTNDMYYYVNNTVLKELKYEYGEIFDDNLKISSNTLKAIVDRISKISLKDTDSDIKGDAFEYFLKTSITLGNDLGEYFTPRHIVNLMIDLLDPKFGEKIYDPTCGTGGFLISSFNYIKKRSASNENVLKTLKEKTVYGRELTSTARIAKMNMIIAGDGHTNVQQIDSLANPLTNQYDIVVANPPYGQNTSYGTYYPVPDSSGDGIFLQHILKSLKNGGRAAIVIPEGLLFRPVDLKLRKYLLQNCNIHAIISLPKGVFRPYAKQNKTNIIIIEKTKNTESIWFYDLQHDGFDLNSDYRTVIEDNDIPDLLDKWSNKVDSNKSWSVDIETIKRKNFDLMAKTYKGAIEYNSPYNQVLFSDIMVESKHTITINDKKEYKRLTVKLYGQGVVPRDIIRGSKIKTKEQKITKTNQFIVAELDAKFGAFGVVSKELENFIVSSHYFLFDLDTSKILPEYFDYVIRHGPYTEMIQPHVKGTTNYAAIRPKHILQLKIPIPTISEQKRILKKISIKKKNILKLEQAKESAVKDIQELVDNIFQKR